MIVQVIGVALEELVYEHIERKPFPVFQEQIVAFQIGFVVLTIHDHTVSSQALEEFFQHISIIAQQDLLVNSVQKQKGCPWSNLFVSGLFEKSSDWVY